MLKIADNHLQWVCFCFTKMMFLKEDKILIISLRELKGYGPTHFLRDFQTKNWTRYGLANLAKTDHTGSIDLVEGSGHRAYNTVTFLEQEMPDFIPPTLWPPNSLDLNPVDYSIWSVLQKKVYHSRITDLEELKTSLIDEWVRLDQSIIGIHENVCSLCKLCTFKDEPQCQ